MKRVTYLTADGRRGLIFGNENTIRDLLDKTGFRYVGTSECNKPKLKRVPKK